MGKNEIFKKYGISESHAEWNPAIDNWMSVEVYRVMHNGDLPDPNDMNMQYVLDFLDACNRKEDSLMLKLMKERDDAGSLYLTAKRMLYRYSDFLPQEVKS